MSIRALQGPEAMRLAGMDVFSGKGAVARTMREAGMAAATFEVANDPGEDILSLSGQERRGGGGGWWRLAS